MANMDPRELRNALGSFATGVTIVTTLAEQDPELNPEGLNLSAEQMMPMAMTANSFSSVSLDPPLLLWSIDRNALSFDAFSQAEHFAIHILHSAQQGLSNICATKNADKFSEISWHPGIAGIPIFDDFNTCFQCRMEHRYEGGDHLILVGRVLDYEIKERVSHPDPLIFYRGQYTRLA